MGDVEEYVLGLSGKQAGTQASHFAGAEASRGRTAYGRETSASDAGSVLLSAAAEHARAGMAHQKVPETQISA